MYPEAYPQQIPLADRAQAQAGKASLSARVVQILLLALSLAIRIFTPDPGGISFMLLAAYALFGPKQCIHALAFTWLSTMLNPGISPFAMGTAMGRYYVFAAAGAGMSVRFFLHPRQVRNRSFLLYFLFVVLIIMLHSTQFSYMPILSILKALLWFVVMGSSLAAWLMLSDQEREESATFLFYSLTAILLCSLLFVNHRIGYLRNARGFQGVLDHPQAFGPYAGLLAVWSAARLLSSPKFSVHLLLILVICIGSVYLSEARTAGVAMLFGLGWLVMISIRSTTFSRQKQISGKINRNSVYLFVLIGFGLFILFSSLIIESWDKFVTKSKGTAAESLTEAYEMSRGQLIEMMVYNIERTPFKGIGFSIASYPSSMRVFRDPVFGLPISASVEKGVTPIAIVEELGVLLAIPLFLWIIWLLRSSARGGIGPLSICVTILFLNLGEATLFSPGGFGLLPMILLGWCFASGINSYVNFQPHSNVE